jgi:septum site-determining protein MinD
MAKIISIVSGKGGAGKSLLTAVIGRALGREGKDVLIVDLDIFVRGLTVLLYSFRAPSVDKKLTVSDLLGVFSEDSQYRGPIDLDIGSDLTIEKFLEVDVLPSVERINFPLDYDDRSLSDEGFCISVLKAMIKKVEGSYDYIFLDNRAGMDSLVSASCRVSNVVLSVAEDDEVARQTDYNLVQFLQNKKIAPSVYSIVNKGRNITRAHQIDDTSNLRHNFGIAFSLQFIFTV